MLKSWLPEVQPYKQTIAFLQISINDSDRDASRFLSERNGKEEYVSPDFHSE